MHDHHGIDRGDHEWEYDPVGDSINDMVEDWTHSKDVQEWLCCTLLGCDMLIQDLQTAVRIATGSDWWQYPADGDLKALRGAIEVYLDKPVNGKQNARQV